MAIAALATATTTDDQEAVRASHQQRPSSKQTGCGSVVFEDCHVEATLFSLNLAMTCENRAVKRQHSIGSRNGAKSTTLDTVTLGFAFQLNRTTIDYIKTQ